MNAEIKIARLAAEAALILKALGNVTPEEAGILAWLLMDELIILNGETKGGDAI